MGFCETGYRRLDAVCQEQRKALHEVLWRFKHALVHPAVQDVDEAGAKELGDESAIFLGEALL